VRENYLGLGQWWGHFLEEVAYYNADLWSEKNMDDRGRSQQQRGV
jgi:hypothetical protein